jgi:hypothetical protein
MHSASIGPAMVWPRKVDLAKNLIMLDIGGGSGAHSIGAGCPRRTSGLPLVWAKYGKVIHFGKMR